LLCYVKEFFLPIEFQFLFKCFPKLKALPFLLINWSHHLYCLVVFVVSTYTWFPRRVHHVWFDFHFLALVSFLRMEDLFFFLSIFPCKDYSAVPFMESERFDQMVPNSRCVSLVYYYLYRNPKFLLNYTVPRNKSPSQIEFKFFNWIWILWLMTKIKY